MLAFWAFQLVSYLGTYQVLIAPFAARALFARHGRSGRCFLSNDSSFACSWRSASFVRHAQAVVKFECTNVAIKATCLTVNVLATLTVNVLATPCS